MNLACAVGLPGAEMIDVAGCLALLDEWAEGIRRETEKLLATEFRQKAKIYRNSQALYRMVKLVQILKQECGVRFDPAKVDAKPNDPFELHEHFIHGPIQGQGPGGTCATLPLLYTAVARRLGYPVRLVIVPGHLLCRWDDPSTGERFNIDGSGKDVSSNPDDYYRKWPVPFTSEQEKLGGFLKSLTPRQELSAFISRRGIHWQETGNFRRAACAYILSGELDDGMAWKAMLIQLVDKWETKLRGRMPRGFPKVEIKVNPQFRRWPTIGWPDEQKLRYLEAVENVVNDKELEANCWAPIREGKPTRMKVPRHIVVNCLGEQLCSTHP